MAQPQTQGFYEGSYSDNIVSNAEYSQNNLTESDLADYEYPFAGEIEAVLNGEVEAYIAPTESVNDYQSNSTGKSEQAYAQKLLWQNISKNNRSKAHNTKNSKTKVKQASQVARQAKAKKPPKLLLEDLFEIDEVKGCVINAGNGHFSSIAQMRGLETKLLGNDDRTIRVVGIKRILETQNSPIAFYGRLRPYDAAPYINFLQKRLDNERNPNLRQLLVILIKYFEKLVQDKTLRARTYFTSLSATPQEVSTLNSKATEANRLGKGTWYGPALNMIEDVPGVGKPLQKYRLRRARRLGKFIPTNTITPALAEHLRFKLENMATQFSASADIECRLPKSTRKTLRLLSDSFTGAANPTPTNKTSEVGRGSTVDNKHSNMQNDRQQLIQMLYGGSTLFEEKRTHIKLGNEFIRSYYIDGYPGDVELGAMRDIFIFEDMCLDYALHVSLMTNYDADKKLKSVVQWLDAALEMLRGETDPNLVRLLNSARYMRDSLADGTLRIFMAGMRFVIRANSLAKLIEDERRLAAALANKGFHLTLARDEQLAGFLSAQPLGRDWLADNLATRDRMLRNMRAETIACLMPNVIADELDPSKFNGIPLGISREEGRIVWFQRWSQLNAHTIRGGTAGSGKTLGVEWEIILEMLHDLFLRVFCIDPSQGAMTKLAEIMGGTVINLGLRDKTILNCADRYIIGGDPQTIAAQSIYLTEFFEVLLQEKVRTKSESTLVDVVRDCIHHFEQGVSALNTIMQALTSIGEGRLNLNQVRSVLISIYNYLIKEYNIIETGLVAGNFDEPDIGFVQGGFANPSYGSARGRFAVGKKLRPVTYYDPSESKYYYGGGGLTSEPLPDGAFAKNSIGIGPARVWYPDPRWEAKLKAHFEFLINDSHIFDGLRQNSKNDKLFQYALDIAFLELKRGMPIMSDLFPFMAEHGLGSLVSNLQPYADRNNYEIFNGYTNVKLSNHLVVFSLYEVRFHKRLRPVRAFQALHYINGLIQTKPMIRTMLVADEMEETFKNAPNIGSFFADMSLTGRGNGLADEVMFQDFPELYNSPWGNAIVGNAERIVLMRHRKALSAQVQNMFGLSQSQAQYIQTMPPGQSIQQIGHVWYDVRYAIPKAVGDKLDTRPVKNTKNEISDSASTNYSDDDDDESEGVYR
jgi:hypothetical protein